MDRQTLEQIHKLLQREIAPATGCTEPVCIALTTAHACAVLPQPATRLTVSLSANMIKNAMGVGIPGTGKIGIPIAIALGATIRCPERQLEILNQFSPEELATAEQLVDSGAVHIVHKNEEHLDKLYVEVLAEDASGNQALAVIQGHHTNLQQLQLNGDNLTHQPLGCPETLSPTTSSQSSDTALDFNTVYEYAMQAPLEDIAFIYDAALQNKAIGQHALQSHYGHGVGQMIKSDLGQRLLGTSPLTDMLAYTSGACDARMDGAKMTVMSNSGSGNQGITATLPVLSFAETNGSDRESTTRALTLSSLMVIYIKQLLGRLSGLCGMVVSGIGTSAALVYLMGGSRQQSAYAVQNMIGNVAGMICDGAKPSCSLKASTGVSTAMLSALLAIENRFVTAIEGIVEQEVDDSIRNLAELGRTAMLATDQKVLEFMTHKKH